MAENPERVNREGRFVLERPEARLPASFVEAGKNCGNLATNERVRGPKPASAGEATPPLAPSQVVRPEKEREGHEEAEEHAPNFVKLGTFLEFSRLNANDFSGNHADLTSKPEYGYLLEYERWFASKFFVGASTKYVKAQFEELPERELVEESTSLRSAAIAAGLKLNEGALLRLDAGATQVDHITFARSEAPEEEPDKVNVAHVWVPRINLSLEAELAEIAGFALGAGVSATLFLPAAGTAKTSVGEGVSLFIEREITPLISAELGFGGMFQRQGFEGGTHSYTSYGADLGLGFHF